MVVEITHKNHMRVSSSFDEPYHVFMGKCKYFPTSFKEESLRVARLIKEKAGNKDIWISLSGGIDSEFIARTFLEAGIPFKAATLVYKNGINQYDNDYCRQFSKEVGIDLVEYEIDLVEWFENKMGDVAFNLKSVSPQFPTHTWLWDQLDGFIVAGHGDPIFTKKNNTWYFQVREKEDTIYRWAEYRNRSAATGFYAYTPEILLSFVLEPEISNMFLSPIYDDIVQVKYKVYERCFPDMKRREKKTGFEEFKEVENIYRSHLLESLPNNNRVFRQKIETFVEKLWPHAYTNPHI